MKRNFIFILIMALAFSPGCSFQPDYSITQTESPLPTKTLTLNTPTIISPSATSTPLPTPTPLPPTLTSLPKLTPDESMNLLFELLKNNGQCLLPCLLGLKPEISSSVMRNFFNQFASVNSDEISIDRVRADSGKFNAVGFFVHYDNIYLNLGISSYEEQNQVKRLSLDSSVYKDNSNERLVNSIPWDPKYAEVMNYYLLPQILINYGKPSKIIILTYRSDRQRPDVTSFPFFLVLLYPDQGFYVKYEMERVTSGVNFIGCPSKSFVDVVVWTPNDDEAFESVVKPTINGEYLSDYKSLSDATSLTIEEFYQGFSNPESQICLETPIETWPNP